eukprot:15171104-Alexandrium_andersonii.AAC.1
MGTALSGSAASSRCADRGPASRARAAAMERAQATPWPPTAGGTDHGTTSSARQTVASTPPSSTEGQWRAVG